ncbi:hypothetical protein GCM10018963_07120 [Saccharothrix longispora]
MIVTPKTFTAELHVSVAAACAAVVGATMTADATVPANTAVSSLLRRLAPTDAMWFPLVHPLSIQPVNDCRHWWDGCQCFDPTPAEWRCAPSLRVPVIGHTVNTGTVDYAFWVGSLLCRTAYASFGRM